MEEYIVFAFDSTHEAIKSEKVLEKNKIDGRLIPLPPEISAGCGLSMRIKPEDKSLVLKELDKAGVDVGNMYLLRKEGSKRFVEKL